MLCGNALVPPGRRDLPSQPRPDRLQPLGQFRLEAAIDGPVVLALDAEIVLSRNAALCVVRILVPLAVAEALCAGIVRVAQMHGHRDDSSLADILPGLADRERGSIR